MDVACMVVVVVVGLCLSLFGFPSSLIIAQNSRTGKHPLQFLLLLYHNFVVSAFSTSSILDYSCYTQGHKSKIMPNLPRSFQSLSLSSDKAHYLKWSHYKGLGIHP